MRRRPPLLALFADGAGWCAVFTIGFFLLFPILGRLFLSVLTFVLETLDGVGTG